MLTEAGSAVAASRVKKIGKLSYTASLFAYIVLWGEEQMDIKNIYPNLTDDLSTLAIIANQLLTEIDLQLSQAQVIIKSSDDVYCVN